MKKKISVIINVFNGGKFIHKCINSVLNQTYKNFEIIVWDNKSTDKTKKKVKEFRDQRIKYFFSKKHFKLYKARNLALKKCTGEFIAFIDCDDWWDKNFLAARENFFNNKNFLISYCNSIHYYESSQKYSIFKNKIPSGYIFDYLSKDYVVKLSSLVLNKKIFKRIGYFNEDYNIIGDYDFVMRAAIKFPIHSLIKPYLFSRFHKNNFTKLNYKMFFLEYKNWYENLNYKQIKNTNLNLFKIKLDELEIIYLLMNNQKFLAFLKIYKYPFLIKKIKFLVLFFLPLKILKVLKK